MLLSVLSMCFEVLWKGNLGDLLVPCVLSHLKYLVPVGTRDTSLTYCGSNSLRCTDIMY